MMKETIENHYECSKQIVAITSASDELKQSLIDAGILYIGNDNMIHVVEGV